VWFKKRRACRFDHGPAESANRRVRVGRLGTAFTVRTGNHDHLTIGIAKPHFPLLGRRVDVRFFDNFGPEPASALHDRVKVVDLEPQQDTVSGRRRIGVDEIRVIFLVPSVELKNQPTGVRDPLVQVAAAVFRKRVCSSNSAYQRLFARTLRTAMRG
jgi:hypothetical protein